MMNSGTQPAARGKIVFVNNPAQSSFFIAVDHMTPRASYNVVVNGAVVDQIATNASGHGKVTHKSKVHAAHAAPLPYDPRGASIQIASGTTVVLSADMPDSPEESDMSIEIPLDLTAATGVTGSASAEFRERGGRMKFEVKVEDAVPGTYDLIVAGSNVGQIVVGVDGSGELQFDSVNGTSVTEDDGDGSEDSMDLLLTFDPRGQTIEIQQLGVTDFSGTLPDTPPPAGAGDDDGDQGGDQGGDGD
jgi:hypothetical protein